MSACLSIALVASSAARAAAFAVGRATDFDAFFEQPLELGKGVERKYAPIWLS
jgi:hypothetical protein